VIARVDETTEPLRDHLFSYTDGSWREVASIDASAGEGYAIPGASMDGKMLIQANVFSARTGTKGLSLLSLTDGKLTDLYYEPLYDVPGAIKDVWSGRVVGAGYTSHVWNQVFFDPALKQVHDKLEADFPGMSVQLESWDAARNKFVFGIEGPRQPTTFYLYNQQNKTVQKLGRTYTNLLPSDLSEVRVYDYKARDGLKIPAYLTVPLGKEVKNLPVVILPHGGPWARDDLDFDWESQFLASRGYAVLRPNFRGSRGYGQAFEKAGHNQWGLKMQDDVTDGVKKLIADGIADPKRICIAGGSYGGYAALAGAAFTPDIYACAAAWAPVTDLRQKLVSDAHRSGGDDSWLISAQREYIGDRLHDAQKLDEASPAKAAGKIKVPVLLMHGEVDSTVPIEQSEIMERALKAAGKKVTFVRIPNETHNLQAEATRIRWLTELEKFLKENIGN
jgi:dipeptidyl aminopeptidase/acylaminoacyl peptidase